MRNRFPLYCCFVALMSIALDATALHTATAQEIPSVEEIVAKHMEVTGGEEKYNAITSLVIEGEVEVPEAGIKGSLTAKQMAPNLTKLRVDLGRAGTERSGHDGETAWTITDVMGPQIMEGEQKNQFLAQSDLRPFSDLDKKYDEVKCTGIEEHDGEDCYVVFLKKGDDDPILHYFNVESGLHTGTKQNAITPSGKMEIVTTVSDYKEINGIKLAHKNSSAIPLGFTQVITLKSVKFNVDLDESEFELPEEIKEIK